MTKEIADLIEPAIAEMGFELVRVRLKTGGQTTLQVMAERPDGTMEVDDCATLSGVISAILDVADPIPGEYHLEVSSPGIDRPLIKLSDYEQYAGYEAKIELHDLLDGRKRFNGKILGVDQECVLFDQPGTGKIQIPMNSISHGQLILTDELIAQALKRQEERAKQN